MELFRESGGCVFNEEPAVLIRCKHDGNDIKMIIPTTCRAELSIVNDLKNGARSFSLLNMAKNGTDFLLRYE